MSDNSKPKIAATTIDTYEGDQNLLLIFAGNENDPNYQRQCELLDEQEAAFTGREVLVKHLFADGESNLDGSQSATTIPLELRERYKLAEDEFAIVLIDKNGSVRMREQKPTPVRTILQQLNALD